MIDMKPRFLPPVPHAETNIVRSFTVAMFVFALLPCTGTPAHAQLIDLGNGMVYDTVQDLTWLQDTHYARTSGYDADGWMPQSDAIAWADNLTYGGFADWRLPLFSSSSDLDHSSEISTLLAQLGWHWPQWGDVVIGDVGSFLNFFDTPWPAVPMYWLDHPATIWNEVYVYDVRDGGSENPAGAWAVRSGHPFQPTTTDQCKKRGWQNLTRADFTPFATQGDCTSYVTTGR